MTDNIDQKIAARKQQAEERQLYEKALLIATELGATTSTEGPYKDYGRGTGYQQQTLTNVFNDASADIVIRNTHLIDHNFLEGDPEPYNRETSNAISITFKGQEVFVAKNAEIKPWGDRVKSIDGYIPGTWEKAFNAVYKDVKTKVDAAAKEAARKAAEQKAAADKAKRKPWGL